jgi:hypothetical protein
VKLNGVAPREIPLLSTRAPGGVVSIRTLAEAGAAGAAEGAVGASGRVARMASAATAMATTTPPPATT